MRLRNRAGCIEQDFSIARSIQQGLLPAVEIISWLHAVVLGFAEGTAQQDDLTAVIIKRTPTDAS